MNLKVEELKATVATLRSSSARNTPTFRGIIEAYHYAIDCLEQNDPESIEEQIWDLKRISSFLDTGQTKNKAEHDTLVRVLNELNYQPESKYGLWVRAMDWVEREILHEDIARQYFDARVAEGIDSVVLLFAWDKLDPIAAYRD